MKQWTISDSDRLYNISKWGNDFFHINNKGNISVRPFPTGEAIDIKELTDNLAKRKIATPVLIRFTDIIKERINTIFNCFQTAVNEYDFTGGFQMVFPIKANQQKEIVETVVNYGKDCAIGLEAGSKPELLVVMAISRDNNSLIVCNGYKDEEFIETALIAQKMGKNVVIVAEKLSEIKLILDTAERIDISPNIGIRIKLTSKGSGRWASSSGQTSKFGLRAVEIVKAVKILKEKNMLDSLTLLHFHTGSQITEIRCVKEVLEEGAHMYTELIKLGACLKFFDIGGGLGVDYDGTRSNSDSSINYTLQEYANDVIYRLKAACEEAGVKEPTVILESGRALLAYHSILVTNIVGVSSCDTVPIPKELPADVPAKLTEMLDIFNNIKIKSFREDFHDIIQFHDEMQNLFRLGHLPLEHRGIMEAIYWGTLQKIKKIVDSLKLTDPEFQDIDRILADTYFANFSIFNSIPDAWAIDQLFPILPIQRLDEKPDRNGVIADITCDSDGILNKFVGSGEISNVIPLHTFSDGDNYHIGIFLIGAYQDVLGDYHNLFGAPNLVHISLKGENGNNYEITNVFRGDTVKEVLRYHEYTIPELVNMVRVHLESRVINNELSLEDTASFLETYENGLNGYTYLE